MIKSAFIKSGKRSASTKSSKKLSKQISTGRLFRTSLLYQTKEFFNNSTLHGVRYIAETGRPFAEKFMWFCFTSIGAVAALIIIVSLWEKFQTNPTITGLDTDFHNQQVIFPTIVVCPVEPYSDDEIDAKADLFGNYEPENKYLFKPVLELLTKLSFANIRELNEISVNLTKEKHLFKEFDKPFLRRLVFEMKIPCNATFSMCKYRDEDIRCCDHFSPVYSEHGLCFAFNTHYTGTEDSEDTNDFFHDLFETDKKWSLLFLPRKKSYIFVHSHTENFGWDFRPQILWDINYSADLLISMKQTYTTDDAKQLSIGQRKCIFPDELKLDIYNDEYTFSSCMKECRIQKCIKLCQCIPPFYRPWRNHPYCTISQLKCVEEFLPNITDIKTCSKCELSCSNTVFDIEKLSKTSISDLTKLDEAHINIEFLTWPIIRYKREVLFGWVDLLVSFGGIAGLFLGFSLLSGVEIIYYFTMRACCMLYKNRDELYQIEEVKLRRPLLPYNLSIKPGDMKRLQPPDVELQGGNLEHKPNEIMTAAVMNNQLPRRLNRANLNLETIKKFNRPMFKVNQVAPYEMNTRFRNSDGYGYMP